MHCSSIIMDELAFMSHARPLRDYYLMRLIYVPERPSFAEIPQLSNETRSTNNHFLSLGYSKSTSFLEIVQ